MKIEGNDPKSGKKFSQDAPGLTQSKLEFLTELVVSDEKLSETIDNLDVSADAKSLLYKIAKVTITVGRRVVKIGRKILDVIVSLFQEYPQAGFGMLLGAILGFLVSSIPIIGVVLGPLFTPLGMAFGLVAGAIQDFSDKNLARQVAKSNEQFMSMSGS